MLWLGVLLIIPFAYLIVFGRSLKPLEAPRRWIEAHLQTLGYLVPLIYAGVVGLFLYLFDRDLGSKLSRSHLWFCRLLYLLPFSSMALCVFSDPGTITRQNHAEAMTRYPFDYILFMPHNECRTCQFEKPARSKHCSVCNKCVELSDHHCIWVNNCIGRKNYRWFLYFLTAHCLIFIYGFALSCPVVWGNMVGGSVVARARAAIRANETAVCIVVVCFLIGWITLLFTAYTLYFVHVGSTTNEKEKWDNVAELIEDGDLYTYPGHPIVLQKLPTGFNRKLKPHEREMVADQQPQQVHGFDEIINIYDHGFKANLWRLLTGS